MFSLIRLYSLWFAIIFFLFISANSSIVSPTNQFDIYSRDIGVVVIDSFDYDEYKQLNEITPYAASDGFDYRLPNTTKPELYTISIETRIDQNNFNFNGLVRIIIVALETTNEIILHHRDLTIENVILSRLDVSQPISIGDHFYNETTQFLTIPLAEGESLLEGERYLIEIAYAGILSNANNGFYRSSYTDASGVQVWLATTHFEPHNARHAFPCYDEPGFKAIFKLDITHGAQYFAISNTDVESLTQNTELQTTTTTFDETPIMSTYLMAFVISNFDFVMNNQSRIPHRCFARPTAAHLLQLSLDTSVSTLNTLEDYLNVNYTISKMDQIAVPDFAAGAMENWGLVTYRESNLLFDETVNTHINKRAIVVVIAHEYTHQWFGNLVSPEWWTYLWLNEGFARLYGYQIADMVYPDWKIMDYFVAAIVQNIANTDALESTNPMTHYVESRTEVSAQFNNIAYEKSGCVLRMMQHAFTDATFRKGLTYYLTERQFNVAREEHLFEGLQIAVTEDEAIPVEMNVHDIMLSWSHQSGLPLLYVIRNYAENSIQLNQERYLSSPVSENPNTWWIPYNFVSASNPDFSNTKANDWLQQNEQGKIILPTTEQTWTTNDWIIFNKQQTGYYRIIYDSINYGLIADELYYGDHTRIHYLNRAQIIDDVFTFARTNRLNWSIAFDIIKYIRKEIEYNPWTAFTNHFSYLQRFMPGLNNYPYYKQFMGEAFESLYKHLGIDDISDEPITQKYIRTSAISWACYFGSEVCLQQANEKLNDLLNNGIQIHPNLQSVMYCAGARRSGTFLPLYNKFIDTNDLTERRNFISAMSCVPNESGLKQLLELTQETENINFNSLNEKVDAIMSVSENSELGLLVSIQFLIDNNATAVQYFGTNGLVNIVSNMARLASSTDNLRQKIYELIEILLTSDSLTETSVNGMNAVINETIQWQFSNGAIIDNWLNDNGFDVTTPEVVDEVTTTTTEEPETTTPSGSQKFAINTIILFILLGFQLL